MCMPHGSAQTYNSVSKDRKNKIQKKHIVFDKSRMKPDPDFVDERVLPNKKVKKEKSFFDKFFS